MSLRLADKIKDSRLSAEVEPFVPAGLVVSPPRLGDVHGGVEAVSLAAGVERPQHRMLPSYQPDYYPYVQHHPSSPADGLCVTYDAGYDWHPTQQPYSDYGRYGYTTYAVRYDHKDPSKGVYAATPAAGPETNALGCGSSAARAPAALACQAPSVLTPDKTALRTPKAERSRGRKSGSQGSKAEGKERSAEGQGIPDQNGTVPASLPEGSRSTTEPQEPHKMSGINPDVAHNSSSTSTASHGQSATVLTPPEAPPNRKSPRDATTNAATANTAIANANATTSPEAPGSRAPPTLWNRSEEQGEVAARGSGGPVAARGGKSSRGRGGGGGGGGGGTGVTWMQQGRTSQGSERECWRAPARVLSKAGESPDSGIGSTPNGTPSSTSSPSSHPSERRPRNADERRSSRGALPGRGDPRRSDARAEAGAHSSTRGPPAPRVEPEPRDGVPRGRDVQDRADRGSKRSRGGAGRSPCDGADRGFHGRADRGSNGGAGRGPHSGVNKGSIDGASKVLPDGANKGSGDKTAKWPQGDDKALTDEVSKGLPVAGFKESPGGATGWPGARTPTRDMAVARSSEPSDEGGALAAPDRISWPELGAARGDRSWSLGKDGGAAVNGPRPQHGALPGDRTLPTPPTPTVMTWAKVASRPPPLPAPRGPPVSQAAWTSTSTSGRGQQAESSDEDDGGGGGSKKKTQRKKKKSKKKAPKTTVAETPPPHVEPLRFQDDEEFPGLSASLGPRRLPMARPGLPAAGTAQQPQTSVSKKGSGKKSKAPVTLDLGDVLATFERQQHEQQEIAEANAAAATAATSSSALPTSHGSTHLATSRPAKPIISVGTASALLPKKETLLGSSKKSGRGGPAPHNPLDSSAPAVKRGKERETPRAKKPTTLKKVILKEREERKRRRLCEERGLVYVPGGDSPASDADARKDEGGEGKDEGKDEGGEGKDEGKDEGGEGKAEGKDEGKAEEGTEPVDADNDDETEAETESELETEQETEAESDAERPMGGSPPDVEPPDTPQDSSADPNGNQATDVDEDGRESPSPVVRAELPPPGPKIHSRRFRDYCNQVLSREIDRCASAMLLELVRFQERLFERDPERARRKRRLVMGLREVTKHLRLRKLRALIISPNCEKIQAKGGLDEALQTVIALASEQSVPFVFALNRKALGHCLNKKVPVSVVGVFHYGGAETHFQRLVALTEEARSAYRDMVSSLQQQEAAATGESTGHTEDPLEASASPPSVPAHDPTALLHLLRLPQGHREEDPAEGSGRSPGRNARGAAETERRLPAASGCGGGGDDRDEGDDRGGIGGKRPDTNLCQDGVTAVWSGAGRGGVG